VKRTRMGKTEENDGKVVLRLFVTGSSQRSFRAIEAVQSLRRDHLGNGVIIEIVDVVEEPERAEEEKILATPTLIRQSPGPPRRLVGDLGDTDRIVFLLGLKDWVRTKVEE
jgi:circadian clock protein KaiB